MPIDFKPEIFSQEALLQLTQTNVAMGLTTRQYEGQIRGVGDTVNIMKPTSLTVNEYTGTVSYEDPDDSTIQLVINKQDYIAATIKDTDKATTTFQLTDIYLQDGISGLKNKADKFLLQLMAQNAHADNTIDTVTLTKANIIDKIDEARTLLSEQGVPPDADMFMVFSPKEISMIRRSEDFTKASDLSDQTLINGQVGEIYGFRIIESNNVYTQPAGEITTGDPLHKLIPFGVVGATAFANAIPPENAESMRLESKFADGVRALHFYGAKVIREEALGVLKADTGDVGTG